MNTENIKNKLIEGIDQAIKDGWKLKFDEGWGNVDSKCGCALTCFAASKDQLLTIAQPNLSNPPNVPDLLKEAICIFKLHINDKVDLPWINDFVAGFDDLSVFKQTQAYQLGVEIRQHYFPKD